jgi:hypothetical protein
MRAGTSPRGKTSSRWTLKELIKHLRNLVDYHHSCGCRTLEDHEVQFQPASSGRCVARTKVKGIATWLVNEFMFYICRAKGLISFAITSRTSAQCLWYFEKLVNFQSGELFGPVSPVSNQWAKRAACGQMPLCTPRVKHG